VPQRLGAFQAWLKERGLKATSQRDDIARVFFASRGHVSVEELYAAVKKVNPRVGYATVYRTLRLLKECGLALERHFNDGEARFERAEDEKHHHDHFICERCARIIEFSNPEIESLQESIARKLGFVTTRHRLELYGICRECREGGTL
jgi:Fur family transcriptional regulator, ferric uptake regulator